MSSIRYFSTNKYITVMDSDAISSFQQTTHYKTSRLMGRTLLLHYITQISHVWQLSQHSSLIIILYATYLGACFRFYNYKCVDSSSSNFLLRMQHKCQSASLSGGILVPRAHSVILWTWRPLYIYKVLNFVGKPSERHCNFFEYIPSSRI